MTKYVFFIKKHLHYINKNAIITQYRLQIAGGKLFCFARSLRWLTGSLPGKEA